MGDPVRNEAARRTDEVLDSLRRAGARITPSRRAVVHVLVQGGHLTVEEVAAEVRAANPDTSVATVYRTLETLEEKGLAYHVHLGHGPATWHLGDDPHHHLVCQGCGAVIEVSPEVVGEIHGLVSGATGFEIDGRHFALTGLCATCRDGPCNADPAL